MADKNVNNIIDKLHDKKYLAEMREDFGDKINSMAGEEVEFEPLWHEQRLMEAYVEMVSSKLQNSIDEASAVTLGGKAFPTEGWMVIMAGASGSGKGYTIGKQVLIDAKILDVDELKNLFAKISKAGKEDTSNTGKEGAKEVAKTLNMAKNGEAKVYNTKIATITQGKKFDFKNSDDVTELHTIIGNVLGLDDKQQANLINSIIKNGKLQNIIFDITGKSSEKLMNLAELGKKLGYKIALVWVVTNRQVALMRNLMRARVVRQDLFHDIHNKVRDTVFEFLKSTMAKSYDEAWVVFNGAEEVTDLTPEQEKELANNSVFKLVKKGDSFDIDKDFEEKVYKFLGPKEENFSNPSTYKSYDEIKDILKPYMKEVTKTVGTFKGNVQKTITIPKDYKKLNFMKEKK